MLDTSHRIPILVLAMLVIVGLIVILSLVSPHAPLATVDDVPTAAPAPAGAHPEAYTSKRAQFAVQFGDVVIPYRVFGVFVMPGEEVMVEPVFPPESAQFELVASRGNATAVSDQRWRWTAPVRSGVYPLRVVNRSTNESVTLNVFVKVPFDHESEQLMGYRIGDYRDEPLRGDSTYLPPEGFIEVTPETRDVLVAPHFTLGQFTSKQESGYPKFLTLDERLLLKLEMILEAVNEQGIAARTLEVMSGFRTPYYNELIGNETAYSRHLYGDAADVFVDTDDDEVMDDLNDDGEVTEADAALLAEIVESKARETWYQPFVGGLGIYGPAPHRGPFIHVDVRGRRVRW